MLRGCREVSATHALTTSVCLPPPPLHSFPHTQAHLMPALSTVMCFMPGSGSGNSSPLRSTLRQKRTGLGG